MSDDDNIVLLRLNEMRGELRSLREHMDATFATRTDLHTVRDEGRDLRKFVEKRFNETELTTQLLQHEMRDIRAKVSSIQEVLEAQTAAIDQLRVTTSVANKFVARLDDDVEGLQQRMTRLEDKTGG